MARKYAVIIDRKRFTRSHMTRALIRPEEIPVFIGPHSGSNIITIDSIEYNRRSFEGIRIKRNAIKCIHCDEIVESLFTYHTAWCSCGGVRVSGGFTELDHSITTEVEYLCEFYGENVP